MESFGNIQFSSNPFNYTEGLLGDIMDVVEDNKTNTIETTHLQMICQEIELIVKKKGLGENEVVTQEWRVWVQKIPGIHSTGQTEG
jgi:hypothetical protein